MLRRLLPWIMERKLKKNVEKKYAAINTTTPLPCVRSINRNLQRAIKALRRSPPTVFGVEIPDILAAKKWGPAKEAMGQATRRVLPTDQVRFRLATAVVMLYRNTDMRVSMSGRSVARLCRFFLRW